MLGAFLAVNRRAAVPLIDFTLFRSGNFTASVISQVLAGMIELGLPSASRCSRSPASP
jgi:hypothetical protein